MFTSAFLLLHYCFTCLYKCFSPALLLLYSYVSYISMHVYILLIYYSGFTYNIYNICNIGMNI